MEKEPIIKYSLLKVEKGYTYEIQLRLKLNKLWEGWSEPMPKPKLDEDVLYKLKSNIIKDINKIIADAYYQEIDADEIEEHTAEDLGVIDECLQEAIEREEQDINIVFVGGFIPTPLNDVFGVNN